MSDRTSNRVRVLVVDDSDDVRRVTSHLLDRLDYEVVGEANNGADAVRMTEALSPNLVLMDIEMPQMTGIDAAHRIQQRCPTPVILLTAHDSPELIQQARDAGVMAYLVKPLEAGEMLRTAQIALARFQDWLALRELNRELEKRNAQLKRAVERIKTLHGLLPVCAWCGHKVQREDGQWVSMQSYIESHSDAELTHGICPDCLAKMRDGLNKGKK